MKRCYLLFVCLICIFFSSSVLGQGRSKKDRDTPSFKDFGKITTADFIRSENEDLTDAPAVILFDLGEVSFSSEGGKLRVLYRVHRRVKIQSEEGLKWAQVSIPYNKRDEEVRNIRGSTYFLSPATGEIETLRLERKVVADEEIAKDILEKRFPLPGVKVGSIIEYSYIFASYDIQSLQPWVFQYDIPNLFSEIYLNVPYLVNYSIIYQGNTGNLMQQRMPFVQSSTNFEDPTTQGMFMGGRFPGVRNMNGNTYHFRMENVMPLEEEPFTTIAKDNVAKISFQLTKSYMPGRNRLTSWKQLNREMLRNQQFGRVLEDGNVENAASKLVADTRRTRDKMVKIYNYVRNNIVWNGEYSIFVSQDLTETLELKEGNSADINLLLYSMLESAGISVYPVLISTRDNGKVEMFRPDVRQFNQVIVTARVRGRSYFLDALGDGTTFDMLPRNDLNEIGFVIDKRSWGWIDINPEFETVRNTYTRFNLDDNGKLFGEFEYVFKEYSAVSEKGKLSGFSDKSQYVKEELLSGLEETRLIDFEIRNEDPEISDPLRIVCEVETESYVNKADEFIFIKPLLTKSIVENPFQAEVRNSPIDLPCPIRDYYLLGLVIPEGYEIAQTPNPIRVLMPNQAGSFTFNVLVDNNIIHVSSTIFIEKTQYTPQEYGEIKTFFEYVIRKHEEDIILKKQEI